jgi:predicted MFS family arabinose efflux permease
VSELSATPSFRRIVEVVRRNPDYRRLFAANAISGMGDWFDVVALFSLLLELTGKGESVAFVLVCRSLPMFLTGPVAGVIADRLSRRAIMVISDVVRALLVVALLFVHRPDQVWIAYTVVVLHAITSAFFEPAQQATFPNLVRTEDLVVASALENTLWSTVLAVGSALGGAVMLAFGRQTTFALDALSFVISALLLRGLPARIAQRRKPLELPVRAPTARARWARALGFEELVEGARYVFHHRRVRSLILAKACFGLTLGGVLVLLAFFGEKVFHLEEGKGISILWTARGIGSFLGPFIAWRLGGDSEPALRRGITVAFATVLAGYVLMSLTGSVWIAAAILAVANAAGSVLWTYGSSLLQLIVPDGLRGRVFATDMAGMTLTMTASTLVVGHALDAGVSARGLLAGCGIIALVPIALWWGAQRHFVPSAPTPLQ